MKNMKNRIKMVIVSKITFPFSMPERNPKLTPVFKTQTKLKNGRTSIVLFGMQMLYITETLLV
jgi:hypothetical protein